MVPDIPTPMNNELGAMSGIAMCAERVLALKIQYSPLRTLAARFGCYPQNIHLGSYQGETYIPWWPERV